MLGSHVLPNLGNGIFQSLYSCKLYHTILIRQFPFRLHTWRALLPFTLFLPSLPLRILFVILRADGNYRSFPLHHHHIYHGCNCLSHFFSNSFVTPTIVGDQFLFFPCLWTIFFIDIFSFLPFFIYFYWHIFLSSLA